MKKVNRYTRGGRDGKAIICPECNEEMVVYHSCWYAVTCQNCGKIIDKYDFM